MAKKAKRTQKEKLFQEKRVPAKPGSGELFDVSFGDEDSGPVECLGMTFKNDTARRDHFLEKLREKLKDPEFRKIEGFPIGEDEDILALSDPPFYTACPNPFLPLIVEFYGQPYNALEAYHPTSFAADVKEGKSDPIYNAHSYHTKVPHQAIARYLLHYTQPGDVVLDPFCGSGMTGVAAEFCDFADIAFRHSIEADQQNVKWGRRVAILCDLGPATTLISRNFNVQFDVEAQVALAGHLLDEIENELGWAFETEHTGWDSNDRTSASRRNLNKPTGKGTINFVVWSDVFVCSECAGDIVFWEAAMDPDNAGIKDHFQCPHWGAKSTKGISTVQSKPFLTHCSEAPCQGVGSVQS